MNHGGPRPPRFSDRLGRQELADEGSVSMAPEPDQSAGSTVNFERNDESGTRLARVGLAVALRRRLPGAMRLVDRVHRESMGGSPRSRLPCSLRAIRTRPGLPGRPIPRARELARQRPPLPGNDRSSSEPHVPLRRAAVAERSGVQAFAHARSRRLRQRAPCRARLHFRDQNSQPGFRRHQLAIWPAQRPGSLIDPVTGFLDVSQPGRL